MKRPSFTTAGSFGATLMTALALLIPSVSRAADAAWNKDANGDWTINASDWSTGAYPGATSGTTNTDTATFNATLSADRKVDVSAYLNLKNIIFNRSGTSRMLIEPGNNIALSDGALVQTHADSTGIHNDQIGGSLLITGSATFRNDRSTNGRLLINGARGSATTGNTDTIYLDGISTDSNDIQSTLQDGTGGGQLAIVKNGTGVWRLTGNVSTYSGGTTLNAGTLAYGRSGGTGTEASFGTGTLMLNGGTLRNQFSRAAGPTGYLQNDVIVGGNFAISYGNVSLNATGISGDVDLGGATRTITMSTANTNYTLSGVISNGGLTKAGSGNLTLGGVNTYTGDTTVNAGTLILQDNAGLKFVIGANGVNNQVTGTGTVFLDGDFTFDLSGANLTDGNSWQIVDVASLTESYGSNFSVVGFTPDGGGDFWTYASGPHEWIFTESTGLLTLAIPEPGTALLLGVGLTALLGVRRRRAS